MPSILIQSIEFGGTPVVSQKASVFYKLASTPDYESNYNLVIEDAPVRVDGTFITPVRISGLDMGETYTIKVQSKCGSVFKKEMFVPFCYLSINDCILAYRDCKLFIS